MADYLALDAAAVAQHINALLVTFPELADDPDLAADTWEGETDLHRVVTRALNERREAETLASAIKERESDLSARRARFQRKADAMKSLIKSLMDATKQDRLTLPEATISITKARESIAILDIDALPQGTFTIERKPDKAAIKAMIDAGEDVPGAGTVIGAPSLTIRTK